MDESAKYKVLEMSRIEYYGEPQFIDYKILSLSDNIILDIRMLWKDRDNSIILKSLCDKKRYDIINRAKDCKFKIGDII